MNQNAKSAVKSIVLVDNNPIERALFQMVIERMNPVVHFTSYPSTEEFLKNLVKSENLPDVVFLDIKLPQQNGIDCLIKLRNNSKYQFLPIVMYTSNTEQTVIDAAYYSGANHYFIKPNDVTYLITTLEALIQNSPISPKHHRETFVIDGRKWFSV